MMKTQIKNSTLQILLFVVCSLLFSGHCLAASLDTAWSHFYEGEYRQAIKKAQNYDTAQAHYVMGLSYLKLGRPSQAREHFIFILDMFKGADIKEQALLSIADTYFQEGNFKVASVKYNEFLNRYPHSGLKNLVYLKLGQSQRRLGLWQDAKASLNKVANYYPDSFEKAPSMEELKKEFYYYIQVVSFSRRSNAVRSLQALKGKGFNAYIAKIRKDKKTFYRVCVGNFSDIDDARTAAGRLKQNGYTTKIYP